MPRDSVSTAPRRGLRLAGFGAVVLAVLVVIAGLALRARANTRLHEWTEANALPNVSVVTPAAGAAGPAMDFPGRLEAHARAPLYARVPGYLKSWKVDIGAKVKAGQLMAEIEAPDLEQQLLQAKADLASSQANAALASSTARRWQSMLASDSVSKQEVEEKNGDLAAKQALVNAARANVDRLQATRDFTRIVAPFDGVVTARNTDVGALINAGSGSGQQLFVVSDISSLRAYVSVPQTYAAVINAEGKATLTVPERAGKTYHAEVDASAQSVDPATGTVLVELSVDNSAGELLPGGYADVRFDAPIASGAALQVPASALIFDKEGLRVATVESGDKVAFKRITIARDLGRTIEVADGLQATDRVIETPPDGVAAGERVHVVDPNASAPAKGEVKAGHEK
jgi:RND family efflux transporter MFP subunit